ncbi:pentapeptide repeat-containing protein [Thermosynechococcus sp.]|uniref:pentapeptide repeat-containing protein n=1 Tax=Thermosynechococcus sp. TaxID=2814275 RepID=UPI00391937E6
MRYGDLRRANLSGATFEQANMQWVRLKNATLSQTNFSDAYRPRMPYRLNLY